MVLGSRPLNVHFAPRLSTSSLEKQRRAGPASGKKPLIKQREKTGALRGSSRRLAEVRESQEPSAEDKAYTELAKKVAAAKEPVAEVVDRRNREEAKLRDTYSVEQVVEEYVKGRYDLVVDSNEKVLFRAAGEIPDITEGVLKFFREKQK